MWCAGACSPRSTRIIPGGVRVQKSGAQAGRIIRCIMNTFALSEPDAWMKKNLTGFSADAIFPRNRRPANGRNLRTCAMP